jgi:hypothetical protein
MRGLLKRGLARLGQSLAAGTCGRFLSRNGLQPGKKRGIGVNGGRGPGLQRCGPVCRLDQLGRALGAHLRYAGSTRLAMLRHRLAALQRQLAT